jgi:ubiquinone/menaquinone biosynthesis C-methylase UbiE
MASPKPIWPKSLPRLDEEQQRIREDFYRVWLEAMPRQHKFVEWFDHGYAGRRHRSGERTLDVGAGIGTQLEWEDLDDQEYVTVDVRENLATRLKDRFPQVTAVTADVQEGLPFPNEHFGRVNAIHVLEHLPNLPPALDEIRRVLKPDGRLVVVIPCEQGKMYSLARQLSARPLFEKRYGTDYDWFVATEHCNLPWEIEHELRQRFEVGRRAFFPLLIPSVNLNLAIGMTCTPSTRPKTRAGAAGGAESERP